MSQGNALPQTPVIRVKTVFRVWRQGGDIIALMPDEPGDNRPGSCLSYMHIGQHGSADYAHCIAKTRPATPEEYGPLARELESIGYALEIRAKR